MKLQAILFALFISLASSAVQAFDLNLTYACIYKKQVYKGQIDMVQKGAGKVLSTATVLELDEHATSVIIEVKKWQWNPTQGYTIALKKDGNIFYDVKNVALAHHDAVVTMNHDLHVNGQVANLQCYFSPKVF